MNPINDPAQMTALVSVFVAQLPVLIVCLLGCVAVTARKNDLAGATSWAFMGFGLSVVLCVLIPVVQIFVQKWVLENGSSMGQRASVFAILGLVWSVLRAASFALLLMAILAGRQRSVI